MTSPTEFDKNRYDHEKSKTLKNIHSTKTIMGVIVSCKTQDHLESCRHWVGYLYKKKIIDLYTLEGLDKSMDLKEIEIGYVRERDRVLPHLKRRCDQIEKDDRNFLRVIK